MDLITVIVVLVAVGIIVWAAERYLPMAQPFKGIAIFLIILIFVLWLLRGFGIFDWHYRR